MARDSFIFYREYKEAMESLADKQRLEFYDCITDYAFYRKLPDNISPVIKSAFTIIKNRLDKTNTSYWNFEDRRSTKYKIWKQNVLKRDKYICQKCGSKNNLVAHHIKPFATDKEARFDIDNGITLCQTCHKEVHRNER